MSKQANKTSEDDFWKWFERNEPRFFHLEADRQNILDEIFAGLSAYQQGLAFEISKEHDGKREFIISADGLEELFPAVNSLTAAAPEFERWSIVAFRPRVNDYTGFTLDFAGKTFDPLEMWIDHSVLDDNFDLTIYHPNYAEDERDVIISATCILLDMALGEYDAVTGIRYIDHEPLPDNPEQQGLRPFSELRSIFDGCQSHWPQKPMAPN